MHTIERRQRFTYQVMLGCHSIAAFLAEWRVCGR